MGFLSASASLNGWLFRCKQTQLDLFHWQVDIFSYGVMMIHIMCGCWPFPSEAVRTNPKKPTSLIAVSEFDRRKRFIEQLGGNSHPLMTLIKKCLNNSPSPRPTALEVHQQVSVLAADNAPSYVNRLVMLEKIKILKKEKELMIVEKEDMKVEMDAAVTESKDATKEKACVIAEMEKLTAQVESMRTEILQLKAMNEDLHESLKAKEYEIDAKVQELTRKEALLVNRSEKIHSLEHQLDNVSGTNDVNYHLFTHGARLSHSVHGSSDTTVKGFTAFNYMAVYIRNKIYVLYNYIRTINDYSDGLFTYSLGASTREWKHIPDLPVRDPGFGHLFEKVLLVSGHKTGDIHEFNEESQQWEKSTTIPPMPTARCVAAVATWTTPEASALIVC